MAKDPDVIVVNNSPQDEALTDAMTPIIKKIFDQMDDGTPPVIAVPAVAVGLGGLISKCSTSMEQLQAGISVAYTMMAQNALVNFFFDQEEGLTTEEAVAKMQEAMKMMGLHPSAMN